jgi:alpha-tubulin suppressor-like RCC1 family protein
VGVGTNHRGQVGDGTTEERYAPVRVQQLTGVAAIAANAVSAYALKSDGTVWAWGDNEYGQLGDNTMEDRGTPGQVSGLTGVIEIAAASASVYALKAGRSRK